jgi:solute carrier family 35 protein F5
MLVGIAAGIYYCKRAGPARRQRVLGMLLILFVVCLWTTSSVVVQLVFETGHFRKPFFLTYLNTCLLSLYLPFYPRRVRELLASVRPRFKASRGARVVSKRQRGRTTYDLLTPGKTDSAEGALQEMQRAAAAQSVGPSAELSAALRLSVIFFAYQLFFNVGLELSSVSMVTVISASSGLWTLLFSALRLRERVGVIKLLSTLLTFGGVLLVVLSSASEQRPAAGGHGGGGGSSFWGNGATLLSSLLYGAYAAQLKHEVPKEERLPMPYLFGLIGAVCLVIFAPAIAVLHVTRIERFSIPGGATLLALLLNGVFGSVISNMLLARAMLLASPLVATVGLSLSIPLAIAADAIRGRANFADAGPLLGTAAVWLGFLGVSGAEPLEKRWCAGVTRRIRTQVAGVVLVERANPNAETEHAHTDARPDSDA